MAIPTRAELDAMVAERIAADPGFRDRLRDDPRGVVSELVGVSVPEAVSITVHEESLTDVHLVLPAAAVAGQLAEDDLELIAGGSACWGDSCAPGS